MESEGNGIDIITDKKVENDEFKVTINNISHFHNYGLQPSIKAETLPDENDNSSNISKVSKCHVCAECKHSFIYLKNLRRHVKTKHPSLYLTLFPSVERRHKRIDQERSYENITFKEKQSPENIAMPPDKDAETNKTVIFKVNGSYVCPECKNIFSYFRNLKRHVSTQHPCLYASLFPSINHPHKCDICGKTFKTQRSLQFHRRNIHEQHKPISCKKHKCPLCSESFERRNYHQHFEKNHNLSLKPIKLKFESYRDFCDWKTAIERITRSYFVKHSSKELNGTTRHTFTCHRSGMYRSTGENRRKLKAQGSRKMNAFCPAALKVMVKKEGNCEVMFQSDHVGHDNDLQHLNLTCEERKYIAEKLTSNLPLNDILNDIRDSAAKSGSERLSLLTRKDLHNIKASLLKDTQDLSMAKYNEHFMTDLKDIHDRHTESEQLNADIAKTEKGWLFTFVEQGERYLIKENSKSCDCPLICSYCKACNKSYICNCSDSSVDEKMCKHIHFFCMKRNNLQDDANSNDSIDCDNDMTEITSDTAECSHPQTSDILAVSVGELFRNKPNNNFVDSEKSSRLANKFSDLVNSIETEEEYNLFEKTLEKLAVKQKSIQNKFKNKDMVIPASTCALKSVKQNKVTVIETERGQHNSNCVKTAPKPLLLEFLNPVKHGAKICYIHFEKSKLNFMSKD